MIEHLPALLVVVAFVLFVAKMYHADR